MRFIHSVKITVDNFGSVFKYLLYRVVTGIVFFSIIYVILRLSLSFILDSAELQALKNLTVEIVKCIFMGRVEELRTYSEQFLQALADLGNLIVSGGGAIAGAVVGVCLIYIVARIVDGLATFAMGSTLNDRMSIFARTPFSTAYFKSAPQGILYELIYVPLSFLYDAFAFGLCWFIFFYLRGLIFSATLLTVGASVSLAVLSFMMLFALKMTLISAWIPAMIADKTKVGKAFAQSFKAKKGFGARYVCFLTSIMIVFVTNVVFGVFTAGSALLITVPLSYLFLLAIQFVFYYQDKGIKYFVGAGEIVTPEETNNMIKDQNDKENI